MADSTFDLLAEANMANGQGVLVNNIPSTYKHLCVMISATESQYQVGYGVQLRVNSTSTGKSYKYRNFAAYPGNTNFVGSTSINELTGQDSSGGVMGTGYDNYQELWIFDYTQSLFGGLSRAGWKNAGVTYGSWTLKDGSEISGGVTSLYAYTDGDAFGRGTIRVWGVL